MAASLWRYRYSHTWFGDRKFSCAGTWRLLAGPFYGVYVAQRPDHRRSLGYAIATRDVVAGRAARNVPGPVSADRLRSPRWSSCPLSVAFYRARATSRMLSTRLASARPGSTSTSAPRALFGQFVALCPRASSALLLVFARRRSIAIGGIFAARRPGRRCARSGALSCSIFQSGTLNVVLLIVGYLVVARRLRRCLANWSSSASAGGGCWPAAPPSPMPTPCAPCAPPTEDRALIGEGLADALNVGAY